MNSLKNLNLSHRRVFVRADLNVPLDGTKILQDYRLQRILPTIDYIQKNGGKVILATHIGRPKPMAHTHICDPNLSTNILIPWFTKQGYSVVHEVDLKRAEFLSHENFNSILLLENLRFFTGEQQSSVEFAQLLALCADVYVDDAFGVIHRNDTSITLLPQQFALENRSFGLLVEEEIEKLSALKKNPQQPFIMVMGGSKIADKVPVLEQLFAQPPTQRVQKILVGGAVANAFLQAQGIATGADTVDAASVESAKKILAQAHENKIEIILPLDRCSTTQSLEQPIAYYDVHFIPTDKSIVDIGPRTIELFCKEIAQAKTIFTNGTMGIYEKEMYATGSKKILEAIAKTSATTIIGGGDAVAATYLFGLENKMKFLSTGGGATLEFLGAKDFRDLPGIGVMVKEK